MLVLIQPYHLDELHFAWSYRVYCRWQTYRGRPHPPLAGLDAAALGDLLRPYHIHVLEATGRANEFRMLTSLRPEETVAACMGKAKGRVSKWLREALGLQDAAKLLSRGYFACTTGKPSAEAVEHYLGHQGEHHGYAARINPPIFVERYPMTVADEADLRPQHAVTSLRLHIVLATWRRKGVFTQPEGRAVTARWRQMQRKFPMILEKVSFVPDHVHLAIHIHPQVSPAKLVVAMMNAAQELCWADFDQRVIRAGVARLWQPSAYIGAYGDLESKKITAYIRQWKNDNQEEG